MREFPGTVYIGKEEDAQEETKRWRSRADTAWMDGSRLEDGVVGVAVVLWEEAHPPLLGQQRAGGHTDQSGRKRAGGGDAFTWAATKRSSTPEVFAIYEEMRQLEMRGQWEDHGCPLEGRERAGRSLPVQARGDWLVPSRRDQDHPEQRLLVVRKWRTTVPVPLFSRCRRWAPES